MAPQRLSAPSGEWSYPKTFHDVQNDAPSLGTAQITKTCLADRPVSVGTIKFQTDEFSKRSTAWVFREFSYSIQCTLAPKPLE